jgi:hypothetical protein
MRTTLTLDDDVAVLLERVRRERKTTLKPVVNEALRLGLLAMNAPPPKGRAFKTRSANLGRCLIGSLDDVGEALAVAEGERFR